MVQCGAVLERENGVVGFRVHLAVTWKVGTERVGR